MTRRSREIEVRVGVREGQWYGPNRYHKAPPHSLQNYYCCEQPDFQRHTYLLFCEEDVSVAQLKIKIMKNCGDHLNSDSAPTQTIYHFPSPPPRSRVSASGEEMEDNRVSLQTFQTMRLAPCQIENAPSWMCVFLGSGGSH